MSMTLSAGGNIRVSRFVELSGNFACTECNAANDKMIGIAQEYPREAPLPSVSTLYAAQSGDPVKVYTPGDECLLEIGGTVNFGDRVATANDGQGVAASADETYGAIALESGIDGDRIRVRVVLASTESS